MRARSVPEIRFHHLLTALFAIFLLGLTTVFIYLGYLRLDRMAENSATTIFTQIAARNATRLEAMLSSASAFVHTQASIGLRLQRKDSGEIDDEGMISALSAAIRANPEIHGYYFGLEDEGFLQVIGVREESRLIAALDAPAATWFAIRLMQPVGSGERQERWRFTDIGGKELARREQPASFMPTARPWYRLASGAPDLQLTEPYLFATSGELGVTLAQALTGGGGVFAADLRLHDLGDFVATGLQGVHGGGAILDEHGRVLAYEFTSGLSDAEALPALQQPDHDRDPYLAALLAAEAGRHEHTRITHIGDEPFIYAEREVELSPGRAARIIELGREATLAAAGMLLLALPLAYLVSRHASAALVELAQDAERIKRFDFSGEPRLPLYSYEFRALSSAHKLMKSSLQQRTQELKEALHKLQILVDNGLRMAAEHDHEALINGVVDGARDLAEAEHGQLYFLTDEDRLRLVNGRNKEEIALHDLVNEPGKECEACAWVALRRQPLLIDDLDQCAYFICHRHAVTTPAAAGTAHALLAVPLEASSGELLGVLELTRSARNGESPAFAPAVLQYVEAFAAQAATAFDNLRLLKAQTELIDALVRVLANAIDAKSPYTGRHCARVPVLAKMLAEEACDAGTGTLADFCFDSNDEWREFLIGAWLHDWGKITTPAFVMDKASKLETLHNRIHEIRMRFEVLLRDARIESLQARHNGIDPQQAEAAFNARAARLHDDFAFVAACNQGSERMAADDVARLQRIASEHWLRHFDDRLGLSVEEQQRRADHPPPLLPALEPLLADQPWHLVPRPPEQRFGPESGFKMEVPEHLYNFGELYNLSIRHGTLTAEERFKIDEHVIQTILMLEGLPLPTNLRRVPEFAGTHHETLDGSGYPRRLSAKQLSIPARIMAIADVFEALTAADRPYKKPNKLSEAVDILATMVADGHLDGELFALFLRSGVHLRYAEQYLSPEQIDDIELERYLA